MSIPALGGVRISIGSRLIVCGSIVDQEATDATDWADRLGIDRSELLREALHRHLVRLRAEGDIGAWLDTPLTTDEQALGENADWGPAEDWTDWADAAR